MGELDLHPPCYTTANNLQLFSRICVWCCLRKQALSRGKNAQIFFFCTEIKKLCGMLRDVNRMLCQRSSKVNIINMLILGIHGNYIWNMNGIGKAWQNYTIALVLAIHNHHILLCNDVEHVWAFLQSARHFMFGRTVSHLEKCPTRRSVSLGVVYYLEQCPTWNNVPAGSSVLPGTVSHLKECFSWNSVPLKGMSLLKQCLIWKSVFHGTVSHLKECPF